HLVSITARPSTDSKQSTRARIVFKIGAMVVKAFKMAAVAAGIKAADALDLALIYSERPATAAAVFTQNTFIAAPLIVSKKHLEDSGHRGRALIVNSGNANAATGEAGIQVARVTTEAVAARLGGDS